MHHRHTIRLKEYDYASNGLYFITLCTHNKEKLFGDIINKAVVLNDFGTIVKQEWEKSSTIRKEIILHEYIIMPNHFHAIVELAAQDKENTLIGRGDRPVAQNGPTKKSIGALIAGFKSSVTKQINIIRNTPGKTVWQRNYYEHIIRDETNYMKIAEYIIYNAIKWKDDKYYAS